MQRQGALADSPLAGAHGHEMTHPGEPVGDAGALLRNLLEDPGPSVAGDIVVAFHLRNKFRRPIAYTLPQPAGVRHSQRQVRALSPLQHAEGDRGGFILDVEGDSALA